ncbi:MAG: hypothetical protein ACRCU6_00250 [Fusobacteriaceae bacterium]
MEEKDLLKIKFIFKEYMIKNKLTNLDLSKLTGVKVGTIKTYTSGRKFVSDKFISSFLKLSKIKKEDAKFLVELLEKKPLKVPTINKKENKKNDDNEKKVKIEFEKNIETLIIETIQKEFKKNTIFLSDLGVANSKSKKNDEFSLKLRRIESENIQMREAKIKNRIIQMHEEVEKAYSEIDFLIKESNWEVLPNLESSIVVTIERFYKHISNFETFLKMLKDCKNIIDVTEV